MTEECITIDSSEEDDVQIMDPPVMQAEPESEEIKRKVPLQAVETGKSVFTALLTTCKNADLSSEMDIIVNKMWKRFHQAESSYTASAKFIEFVKTLIIKASKEPFCQLKSISDDLKFHTIKTKSSVVESVAPGTSTSSNCDESNQKILRTIKKLEKVVVKLKKKIDYLENQEIDLNDSSDEENSAYIQVCRYKKRLCDVYKKICELRRTESFDNCLLGNIKFSGTKISPVNRAIEKFYNATREFPDFPQVLTIVEKANDLKNLGLLPYQCHETAVQAFKELGETLKRKRQFEFHDSLSSYAGSNDSDPASTNQLLEERLQENKKLYGNRIDEIIDKYAKRQIEEKLEPEDVPDDAESESAVEDEELEEKEDDSSIAEVESNVDDSNVDEDDSTNENVLQEGPFEAHDFNIVLPDLRQMPEWAAYQKTERARHSAFGYADTFCQPVPGCSKDIVGDFCAPYANETPTTSTIKRSHAMVSDESEDEDGIESCSKVAKIGRPLISVDLTNDSQSTETATQATKSLRTSFNADVEDPLGSEKASCSRLPNGTACDLTESSSINCEFLKPQKFVVVDVESILAKKTRNIAKNTRNKAQDGGKIVEKPLSLKTESLVTRQDAAEKDVSVSDFGLQGQLKTLSKNGIKIVNVSSVKGTSSTSPADDQNEVSTNHEKGGSEDQAKNESKVSTANCEIMDLDEAACRDKTVSDTMAQFIKRISVEPKNSAGLFFKAVPSTTNTHSRPTFFRSSNSQETKKIEDNRPPWQKFNPIRNRFPVTSTPKPGSTYQPRSSSVSEPVNQETRKTADNRPPWQNFGPSFKQFPATSTPKPGTAYQPRSSSSKFQMPSSNRSNFSPRCYPGNQRHPTSHPQFRGSFAQNRNMRGGPQPPHPRNVYMGPRTGSTKRTMQTTQKFVKGNNIYTQTMTVVQEVQIQSNNTGVRSSFPGNGPVGRGGSSDRRFGASGARDTTRSTSFSSNHSGSVSQDPRQQTKRKNSADVITLE